MHRRNFLKCCAAGGAGLYPALSLAAAIKQGHPLAPRPGHFEPKAKQLVFVFLTGGFSHVDTFDPKPRLAADHGKVVEGASLRETAKIPLLGSPFKFTACGQSGLEISELFPHLQGVADEFCVIRTMHTDILEHFQATLAMYGVGSGDNKSFASQCLIARRLLERGVRVVELIDTGSHDNWDAHGDIQQHRGKAGRVDQPIAALISDLKQCGLLDQTLVAICTEFGRTPWLNDPNSKGRNHWHKAFSCLLAGAGVKGGNAYGETDEYGALIVSGPVHVHDYHATILHLMGIDHTRLVYRYGGRDFRLTDVGGNVIEAILA